VTEADRLRELREAEERRRSDHDRLDQQADNPRGPR
jgi:hypothetical protein